MATNITGGITPYSASANSNRPGTARGVFADWFNAAKIAEEDFMRQAQLAEYNAAMNAEQAQLNRDFQERMARNSYQYAMEDMKKAGINPILALQHGGAATPQGSTASNNNVGYNSNAGKGSTSEFASLLGALGNIFMIIAGAVPVGGGQKIGF